MQNDIRIYYVYIVFRPDGRPCYVGKGKGGRWKDHLKKSHNRYLARIVAIANGMVPIIKVRECLTDADAVETEMALIAAIGRICNGGPLVNMTDGGEGVSGLRHSEEFRRLNGERHKGNKYCVGRKASDETRAKQRAAKIGRKSSDAHKQAIGLAHLGMKRPPEVGAKISAKKLGKKWSDDRRAILRAANRSRDPEVREKIRAGTLRYLARKREESSLGVS